MGNKGLPSEKVLHRKDVSNLGVGKGATNRDGYVMFSIADGCCGIKTIDLGIRNGDGFAVDHITFKPLGSSADSKPVDPKPVPCKGGCSVSASGKAPSFWGKSDSELGVPSGVTIEEFTDAKLADGLALVWSDDKGKFDGQPALTTVDDLLTTKKDPGTAFNTGYWGDGQAVTNFARGKAINYGDASGWRRLRLQFSGGVSYVGFSMQQTDQQDELFVVNKGLPSEKVLHRKDVSNLGVGKGATN